MSNGFISYIFKVLENGSLGHMYFGKKIREQEDFGHLIEYVRRDMAPNVYEGNHRFSLEHLRQEYPTYGSGDMRYPAFELEQADGSRVTDFRYKTHRIYKGKENLKGFSCLRREGRRGGNTGGYFRRCVAGYGYYSEIYDFQGLSGHYKKYGIYFPE